MNPLFIAFEGIDGSGKTTQIKAVKKKLEEKNIPVVNFFAPSNRRWGKVAREVIQNKKLVTPDEEFNIMIEDLADICIHQVSPAIQNGYTVLLDRFLFSTWAYQGLKHEDILERIKHVIPCFCKPDLVCVLRVPVTTALYRLEQEERGGDKYEKKELLTKIAKSYNHLISAEQGDHPYRLFPEFKFVGFDTLYPQEMITDYIIEEIQKVAKGETSSRLCW